MWAWTPDGYYEGTSRLRRLFPDYRAAEREHFRRTGIYPAHHLVVLRREVVDAHPWAVRALYEAFRAARERAEASRLVLHESSAWLLADLEEQAALFGRGYQPYGYRENRSMVAAFCQEQWAQGLVPAPVDPDLVFADFERLLR
jgi:4,5-dihydroxyphthalate decarboxylase